MVISHSRGWEALPRMKEMGFGECRAASATGGQPFGFDGFSQVARVPGLFPQSLW